MRVVKFPKAQKCLDRLMDQAVADADFTIITRTDAPDAVLMSLATFHSLMETVHLLRTPANSAHLAHSIEQYRKGETLRHSLEKC